MTAAVFWFGIACVLIQNVESDLLVCPKHKTGQVDGVVSIECKYSTITKANKYDRKYCCLEGAWPQKCKYTIISTKGYVHPDYMGRALIEDNRNEGSFVFTLSDLQKTDELNYVCGLGIDQQAFKAVIKVVIIEDSKIPPEANLVYGQLWGTVKLPCEFGDQHAEKRKYVCKVDKNGCTNVIDSSGNIDNKYTGRTILQVDERKPGSFIVQIIHLRNEDSGMYSCGVGDNGVEEDTNDLDLRINEDQQKINGTNQLQGPRLLRTRLGGSVSVLCNYDPKKNLTLKFWCKLDGSACNTLINTNGFLKDGKEGKLLIQDDPTKGHMQVLMNQISKEDEGWYWCVQTDGKHDQTSAVQIKISEDIPEGLIGDEIINVKKGEMAKLSCSYPCRLQSSEKSWCKWNNIHCKNISTNVVENKPSGTCGSQNLVLTIGTVSQEDDGWYWCVAKESGLYIATKAMWLRVEEQTRNPPNIIPRGGSGRSVEGGLAPPSVSENKHNTLLAACVSVGAAVLVACAVFFIIRLKKKRNSDLVSVGSYRTNISMTDLDNDVGKENPAVIDTQETNISHSNDEAKIKKKGSQEDLDYSSFLIYQNGSPNEENPS